MKVAHIFWGLGFGGIETMLVNIANIQAKTGTKVSIIIINNRCELSLKNSLDKNINFYILGRKVNSFNISFIIKLNYLLYKINPDVIHLHRSNIAPYLNPWLLKKTCVTIHALPTGSLNKENIFKRIYNRIKKIPKPANNVEYLDHIPYIFSISKSVAQDLKNRYNLNSTVIYNGINTKLFKIKDEQQNRIFRIVMVSRLEHTLKGQDLLIEAISKLQYKILVDFIGSGSSLKFLQELVKQLNCESNVTFFGKKDQKYITEHLADYDLFVQPSRWEGFGLTVVEAMAAQVPVLVSEGQGPAEIICGNKYGWIFKNGNVNDLAEKIVYISTHYNDAISKAKEAQIYAQENYDVHSTAKSYLNEYQKITSKTASI